MAFSPLPTVFVYVPDTLIVLHNDFKIRSSCVSESCWLVAVVVRWKSEQQSRTPEATACGRSWCCSDKMLTDIRRDAWGEKRKSETRSGAQQKV